jgi:hypothetical protein
MQVFDTWAVALLTRRAALFGRMAADIGLDRIHSGDPS